MAKVSGSGIYWWRRGPTGVGKLFTGTPGWSFKIDGDQFTLKVQGKTIRNSAYFSPSWTAFQADRGRDFSVIVDGISN